MLNLFKLIIKRWRKKYVRNNELENHWNDLQISIVEEYVSNLSTTCDFPEFSDEAWEAQSVYSFKQELKGVFVVPRLNSFNETQNRINKSHLVEAFLSFLLRLLHNVTDSIDNPIKDRIDNLEKELRFLLTILGDISWMLCDSHEHDAEFQNLLAEFEAVANQAGNMVHSLLFSTARAFQKMDEGLAAVFKHIHLLKVNLESSTSISAYTAPRTSIVDSIVILDSLVDDLKDLLKGKDDRIAGVKDQIKLLHKRLMHLLSSIDEMRSPQPSEIEELKEPLMRIGDMAYQAEYLITSFLVKDAPLWYVIRRLTELNHKVKVIRKELKAITQKYQFGGFKMAEYFSAGLPLHDKRNTEANEVTVGFEEKTIDILDQLVGGTKSLQVISILGMPGLGKTTLAKKLYNHASISHWFDKLAWCVVSQTYQMCDILSHILTLIESKFGKEEIRVEHIHKTLKGRRYLIVLDDIWHSNVLDELLTCFPDDENGSRILLTGRNKDVAPPSSKIHELPFLSNDQCWELLEKKVFGAHTCPPELEGIGRKIAAKCRGLPLTVVVIAGVLSTVDKVQSTWEEVGRSLTSYLDGEDNSVMQTLELSYKHLPDHLKPCFLYFGTFEEDKEISVGKLKRLWVAEGFIRIENKKNRENIAEEYLMELINRSLVMVAKRRIDGRGVKACVVHDLLRDMCLKKSKEESFLEYLKNDNYTICEKGHRLRALGDAATLSHCQHVRSFYGDGQISSLCVRDMRLLRVLHFSYIQKYNIHGIEYLVNLRFLVIKNLPTWIDRLLNLEYLRVESSSETVYLPPSIVKMVKLRYLHALFAEYGEDWSSYQTNNLEFLSGVTIKKLKDEYLLKCSRRLRKLKCKYDTRGITDKKSYPCFDLRFLTQLDSLSLKFYHHRRLNLRKFGFPSNIRKLTLSESRLRWERISIIGRLQNLEVLKLSRNAFEGERWDTRDGEFQKLRFLQLDKISLSQWNVESNEHFPKLQQLILIACLNLQEIPSEIGDITTLQLIEVKGHCLDSLVESADRIKQEQQDMDNEDLRVIISTTD